MKLKTKKEQRHAVLPSALVMRPDNRKVSVMSFFSSAVSSKTFSGLRPKSELKDCTHVYTCLQGGNGGRSRSSSRDTVNQAESEGLALLGFTS